MSAEQRGFGTHGMTPGREDVPIEHRASARSADAALGRCLALVRFLRERCPWDARQTPSTLRPYLLEEAHETADAIRSGDDSRLADELGDLLLNVAFQIVLAEERGAFSAIDVIDGLERKMRARHPHVYGDAQEAPDWEAMKARERTTRDEETAGSEDPSAGPIGAAIEDASASGIEDPFEGVPAGLEPLSRALRLQDRAAGLNFDWPHVAGALAKLHEEVEELEAALEGADGRDADGRDADGADAGGSGADGGDAGGRDADGGDAGGRDAGASADESRVREELGDVLFATVNVARLAKIHPSLALDEASAKFARRFRELLRRAGEAGIDPRTATLAALDDIWEDVKSSG